MGGGGRAGGGLWMAGRTDSSACKPLAWSQAFHSLTVTGLDTCVRKPLVATCGTDKSVRVWNYLDKSTDLCKVHPRSHTSLAHAMPRRAVPPCHAVLSRRAPLRPAADSQAVRTPRHATDVYRGVLPTPAPPLPLPLPPTLTLTRRSPRSATRSPSTPPGCTCSAASPTSCAS